MSKGLWLQSMRSPGLGVVIISVYAVLGRATVHACEPGLLVGAGIANQSISEASDEDDLLQLQDFTRRIADENGAALLHEWAGTYSDAFGGGEVFQISPSGLVTWRMQGCLGPTNFNFGSASFLGSGRFRVEWRRDLDKCRVRGANTDTQKLFVNLLLIKWGDVQVLLPEHRIIELCNAYNSKLVGKVMALPLRNESSVVSDFDRLMSVVPSVPDSYRPFLFDAPVQWKIHSIRVSEAQGRSAPSAGAAMCAVVVGAASVSAKSMMPGMIVYSGAGREGVVSSSSAGKCEVLFDVKCQEVTPDLLVGDVLNSAP